MQQQTIDLWKRIAHRYRNETAVMGYDLLNEPLPHYPQMRQFDAMLEPLYKRITAAIRTEDKHHAVILGGAKWDGDFTVFGQPFDSNVIYQLHVYWTDPVKASVQRFIDFRDKYHVPIWLGESGENKDEWIAQFSRMLEANDLFARDLCAAGPLGRDRGVREDRPQPRAYRRPAEEAAKPGGHRRSLSEPADEHPLRS
jgi:hypothetical protein